jgi:formyl-CoA transferase
MDSSEQSVDALPLTGIRVIELASVWAMPGAGMYLADQGADVIKVEPIGGEIGRTVSMSPPINGLSRAFWGLNRNKRGICVDIKTPEGADVIRNLASEADVLIHNFRPGVDERLGIDYERLSQSNPRLVYVAYNAFGANGPRRNARGYDLGIQAAAGIATKRAAPDGSPQPIGIFAVDMASSIMAGYAVMLALFARERTGRGKKITGSLLQTGLALQVPEAVRVAGIEEPPIDPMAPRPAIFSPFRCADDVFIQLSVASDAEWKSLCQAMERPDLADDPTLATGPQRVEQSDRLRPILDAIFVRNEAGYWQDRFDEFDAPGVKMETPQSIFESEQAIANNAFVDIEQPGVGRTTVVGVPFELSDTTPCTFSAAPDLGQHTDVILSELGCSPEQVEELRRRKIVA